MAAIVDTHELSGSGAVDIFPTVSVSPEVFESHPDAAFWIGNIATIGAMGLDTEVYSDALGKFRGNVYVHQRHYLSEEALDDMGRERDEYDDRSVHFVVVESRNESDEARVIGSIRLIKKDTPEDLYPVEKYFPELFPEPIGTNTAEVSRFIASYPEDTKLTQHFVALSLIRTATLHAVQEGIDDYYCVIEKPLLGLLQGIGIPMEDLSKGNPKNIPEQGGILYPIKINAQAIIDSVTVDKTGNIILRDFFEKEIGSGGEGYYPSSLVGGTYE